MLPIIESITNIITPILTVIRTLINIMPWKPEINYAIVAGIGGYFVGRVEYIQPWKIGIIVGALIYIALMFI